MNEEKTSSKLNYFWIAFIVVIAAVISVLIIWFPILALELWLFLEPWLWLILSVVGILVVYKILVFIIGRYSKKSEKFPKDAANGLILIVRIAVIIGLLFVIMPALAIPSTYLVDISTIMATAIGFAATIAVSNIIAGIYMIAARPYKIGDYINVGGSIEGVIQEVGLNYTKLKDADAVTYRIPNNKIFSSDIMNFSLEPLERKKSGKTLDEKALSFLSDALSEEKIVRYIFDIELALDLDSEQTIRVLDEICERWEPKFGYRPQYFIHQISWRITVRWALFSTKAQTIMDNGSDFLEDIWMSAYKFKEVAQ